MASVIIGILTYNSYETIARCIRSVQAQTYNNFDLMVFDNNSADGTVSLVREKFPNVNIIENRENVGFAQAHNQIIRNTQSEYYMPLNPDVQLEPGYVESLVRAMEEDEKVGASAGKLYFSRQNGEKTNRIYSTGHLLTKSRSPTNRGYKKLDVGQYERNEFIFAANGAAPLYKRIMLDDVAINREYFCEDFFMYGEDHDLGWRAQLRGWKCVYVPTAIGYHEGFGSGGIRSFYIQTEFTRNRYITLVRNDQLKNILVDLPFIVLYELILQGSFFMRSPRRLAAHWVGLFRALKCMPTIMCARQWIQKNRKVDEAVIRSYFVNQLW